MRGVAGAAAGAGAAGAALMGAATGGRTTGKSTGGVDPAEVRAWAKSEGIAVNERGRISADLLAKFQAAQS